MAQDLSFMDFQPKIVMRTADALSSKDIDLQPKIIDMVLDRATGTMGFVLVNNGIHVQ